MLACILLGAFSKTLLWESGVEENLLLEKHYTARRIVRTIIMLAALGTSNDDTKI